MDLNHRPLGYEPNELPDCSTPQFHRNLGYMCWSNNPAEGPIRAAALLSIRSCSQAPPATTGRERLRGPRPHIRGREALALRTRNFQIYGGADWNDDDGSSLDSMEVQFKAWSPTPGSALEVCLTVNGVNCASVIHGIALPTQAPATPLTLGTTTPGTEYWTDATHAIARPQAVQRTGSLRIDAQGAAILTGGELFSPLWTAGSRTAIESSECVAASFDNARPLRIDTASCKPALSLPLAQARYTADNLGVLIRRKTGTGTIYLESASFSYTTSRAMRWAYGGRTLYCGNALSPDNATPTRRGYHCDVVGDIYWIDPLAVS